MKIDFFFKKSPEHGYHLLPVIDLWYLPPSQNMFHEHVFEVAFKLVIFDFWVAINI